MKNKEYIIFCDESIKKGKFYSNFYGGLIVGSSNYQKITDSLNNKKLELNLFKEIKWTKVSPNYLEKYKEIISYFFQFIKFQDVKIRIMFSQNIYSATNLSNEHIENEYFLLYYQFIKHAFGLSYVPEEEYNFNLRLLFDEFPETKQKIKDFKTYLMRLDLQDEFQYLDLTSKGPYGQHNSKPKFTLKEDNIAEVNSHKHVLLQCLDIVLGSMAFKLNNLNLEKIPGKRVRGKTTKAKELLYKHIYKEICGIRKNFNIGVSTSYDGDKINIWNHPYRHWNFKAKDHEIDLTQAKGYKKTPLNLHKPLT